MGFNYGLEKKNFDSQWAMTRKQYEDAGMSNEAIQAMYDFDWSVFNANRSYQNHTQEMAAPSFEQLSLIHIQMCIRDRRNGKRKRFVCTAFDSSKAYECAE